MADLPLWFYEVTVFILGLCLGSFANVVIYRLPKRESVAVPGSHCPKCKNPVRWFDNIPVISWLVLRGRCRVCKVKISPRYLLVELLTGILFLLVFKFYGLSWTSLEFLIFVFSLVVVSFIDFDHYILPDVFTLSGIVIGLVGAWLNPERAFMASFWGVLVGGGFLWAIAFVYFAITKRDGMGGGDIKLLGWIGAILGWKAIPFVVLGSSVVGSVVGILVMTRSKEGMKTMIPFGPYLALAALIYMFGGQTLGDWYLSFFFPPSP